MKWRIELLAAFGAAAAAGVPFAEIALGIASAILIPEIDARKARVQTCANSCYQQTADNYFQELYDRWNPESSPACRGTAPSAQTTQPSLVFAGMHGFSSLLLLGWTRRRRVKARRVGPLAIVLLSSFLTACDGCNGEPEVTCYSSAAQAAAAGGTPIACPAGTEANGVVCVRYAPGTTCTCDLGDDCCLANGRPKSQGTAEEQAEFARLREQDRCPTASPFLETEGGHLEVAGSLRYEARSAMELAAETSSDNRDITRDQGSDRNEGQKSMATADETGLSPKRGGGEPNGGTGINALGTGGAGAGGGNARGGSAGGGVGGTASAPPLHNLLDAGNDPSQSAATAGTGSGGVGSYQGGGAGGPRPGTGGFGGDSSGGTVAGGAGGGSVDFSGARNDGANVDPSASADPEDYFTRISLENSLFKIVRNRYQSTSLRWKGEDSARAADRATSVVPARKR